MNGSVGLALALILTSGQVSAWSWGDDSCKYSADRTLDVDSESLTSLLLIVGAGDLVVAGDPDLKRIEVRGKACSNEAALLEKIQLDSQRNGNTQSIVTGMPSTDGWSDARVSMDLVVRLPAALALELKDSSGDAAISYVASLDAEDSSGDLSAQHITGSVRLRDSSGDLVAEHIGGSVTIVNDSSGDITVREVQGEVTVANDSSGAIVMRHIRGDATVEQDSSGDIEFAHIGGSARVGQDSSGSISANDVAGDFIVTSDTSGGIEHRSVRGKVHIPER